ncbi:MAG: DMT family transporter [Actinobacteria bacterium]|nr:DMT family transporter [Actinomycetota bacterium]
MSRRGWGLFAAMCVIWGIPYVFIKIADTGVSAPVLVFARVAGGAVLLLPLAAYRHELGALRPHWRYLAAFAAVEIIVPWLLLSNAERRISSSLSGLLVAAVPILGAVLAHLARTERLSLVRFAGLLVGLGGVVLLALPGARGGNGWSVGQVLLVAVCYAIGPFIASRKLSDVPGLGMTAVCLAFAAVVYAPFAALTWPDTAPSARVGWSLAGLAVICTAGGFLVFLRLIAEAGPARATVFTYVNPAVAVAAGAVALGERITAAMLVSFVLIIGGSVLATRVGRPAGVPSGTEAGTEAVTAGDAGLAGGPDSRAVPDHRPGGSR